jgi:hypothetical protein
MNSPARALGAAILLAGCGGTKPAELHVALDGCLAPCEAAVQQGSSAALKFFVTTSDGLSPAGITVSLENLPPGVAAAPIQSVTLEGNPKLDFVVSASSNTPVALYHSTVRGRYKDSSGSSDFLLEVCRPGEGFPGMYGRCSL